MSQNRAAVHGIASQIADRVSGTFGLGEDAKGGGAFVLKQFPAYLNRWDSQQARNEGVFAH